MKNRKEKVKQKVQKRREWIRKTVKKEKQLELLRKNSLPKQIPIKNGMERAYSMLDQFLPDDMIDFKKNFKSISEKPEKGDVLTCFRASAEFVDAWEKRHVINLLKSKEKGVILARSVLLKIVKVAEREVDSLIEQILNDIAEEKTVEEIANTPYNIIIEQFYWAQRENIPNNPHWSIIETKDLREKEIRLEALKQSINASKPVNEEESVF